MGEKAKAIQELEEIEKKINSLEPKGQWKVDSIIQYDPEKMFEALLDMITV